MRSPSGSASVMAAGAVVAAAAPASASTVTPYWHIMTIPQGYDHPLCLQGDLGGPLGTTVTQQNCDTTYTSASQLWQPVSVSGDIYKFENIGTGRCLKRATGPSTAAPSAVPRSLDRIPSRRGSPAAPGFCLDVPGAQTTPGLQLQTWRCNGTLAQQFWVAQ